ncbi:hypothetical protein HDU99_009090 [Rhizoclosmatium hyalinum]|nr:hypothetical protein HDU99_009090 [Rhizoclosmatium hyalinum]
MDAVTNALIKKNLFVPVPNKIKAIILPLAAVGIAVAFYLSLTTSCNYESQGYESFCDSTVLLPNSVVTVQAAFSNGTITATTTAVMEAGLMYKYQPAVDCKLANFSATLIAKNQYTFDVTHNCTLDGKNLSFHIIGDQKTDGSKSVKLWSQVLEPFFFDLGSLVNWTEERPNKRDALLSWSDFNPEITPRCDLPSPVGAAMAFRPLANPTSFFKNTTFKTTNIYWDKTLVGADSFHDRNAIIVTQPNGCAYIHLGPTDGFIQKLTTAVESFIRSQQVTLEISYVCHNCITNPSAINIGAGLKIFTQVSNLTKDIFMVLIGVLAMKVNNNYAKLIEEKEEEKEKVVDVAP